MNIARFSKGLYAHFMCRARPEQYARSLGVQLGSGVRFYGMTPGMFGSEPWLIRIGDDSHITSGCQFVNHDGGTLVLRHREPSLEITRPIEIGNRVYVGINSIIMPGVKIGNDVVIGAGSIVNRDIPAGVVAAGVPARVLGSLEDYFERLKQQSLGFGHLSAVDKEEALRDYFSDFISGGNYSGLGSARE